MGPFLEPTRRRVWLVLSLVCIAAADVPWGDFQNHAHWRNVRLFLSAARPIDSALNVLLFVPLGFALRGLIDASTARISSLALIVAVLAEGSQVFSHTRIPAVLDVLCNVIGAAIGAAAVPFSDGRSRRAG